MYAADDPRHTATLPGLASGPNAASSSAVPVRLTETTVSHGAWTGESPAVCTSAPRRPASAAAAASSARLGPLVTSAVTAAATSYPSSSRSSPSRTILDWSRPASSRR